MCLFGYFAAPDQWVLLATMDLLTALVAVEPSKLEVRGGVTLREPCHADVLV